MNYVIFTSQAAFRVQKSFNGVNNELIKALKRSRFAILTWLYFFFQESTKNQLIFETQKTK